MLLLKKIFRKSNNSVEEDLILDDFRSVDSIISDDDIGSVIFSLSFDLCDKINCKLLNIL